MKKLLIAVAALACAAILFATDFTRNSPRLRQVHFEVNYAPNGTLANVATEARFVGHWSQVGDANNFFDDQQAFTVKTYNLIASPATTITAAGVTVTRAQLAALIRQDAIDRP